MTQKEDVRKHLEQYGSLTPYEAYRKYGIYRLASCICRLRNEGMDINSVQMKHNSKRYGKGTYVKYELEK